MGDGEIDEAAALLDEVFAQGQRAAFAQGEQRYGERRGSVPGVIVASAALAWIAGAVALCLLAWPVGLTVHAAWWLFLAGWNVIG